MTALIPVWLDLPVTLLECDSKGRFTGAASIRIAKAKDKNGD